MVNTLIIEASIYTTFQIIFIVLCGFLLVKSKIIDKTTMKGLADMIANLFIPCLTISQIINSFNITEYQLWLPVLVYCIICIFVGYLTGLIISFILGLKNDIKKLTLINLMFSNSTSLQLIYVESLSPVLISVTGLSLEKTKSKAYVIVLLYTIFVNILRWSIGYHLMKPNNINEKIIKEAINENNELKIENENKISYNKIELNSEPNIPDNKTKISVPKKNAFFKNLKQFMNTPLISGIFSIILASIPYVGTYLSKKDTVVYKLFIDPCDVIGKCSSALVILILGLNLSLSLINSQENDEKDLKKLTIVMIIILKLIIIPAIGLFLVYYVGYVYLKLLDQKLLCFFLMTNFTTPTAINMITISIINKFQVNNLSRLLKYQYSVGIVTVTIWTYLYIELLMN